MRVPFLTLAVLTLAVVWLGPLPQLAARSFTAHMAMHISVVALAAPLLALAFAGGRLDPARRAPFVFSAVPASVLELVVVWAWHAPALHHAARTSTAWLVLEQGTFLGAGFLVWMSSFGGERGRAAARAGAGVVALLLTSMHMTLLGSLIALAPRALYGHVANTHDSTAVLDDQHRGGALMLMAGGGVYLAGGLWLSSTLLDRRSHRRGPIAGRRLV